MRTVILSALAALCTHFPANGTTDSEIRLRQALQKGTGIVELPEGTLVIDSSLEIPEGARNLFVRGHERGSTIQMSRRFKGKAAILIQSGRDLSFSGFTVAGNRDRLESDKHLPPFDSTFFDFYDQNGIAAKGVAGLTIRNVTLQKIRFFPLLISASKTVEVDSVQVLDSGTLNPRGRNNASGGILLEEGTVDFSVRNCKISRITGNAIWTHSNYWSLRNADGVIAGNVIREVARDAIQVGHATRMRVEQNHGARIGYPADQVDVESHGNPVGVDTAGAVDRSSYVNNRFEDVNGHCIDLDGFYDGEVRDNTCTNRLPLSEYPYLHFGIVFANVYPDMESRDVRVTGNVMEGFAYGGVFLIGRNHVIERNRFVNVTRAECGKDRSTARCNYLPEEVELLRSGVYLAANGGRPAVTKDNVIRDNVLTGFGLSRWCIAAGPGVELSANTIAGNVCGDGR